MINSLGSRKPSCLLIAPLVPDFHFPFPPTIIPPPLFKINASRAYPIKILLIGVLLSRKVKEQAELYRYGQR